MLTDWRFIAGINKGGFMAVNIVEMIDDQVKIQNVLVSVSDKSGLNNFIPELIKNNPEIKVYSTGGTHQALKEILGPRATEKNLFQVSDFTGQPEMQGGLVKTLDFKIYMGLLSETYNPAHAADLQRTHGIFFDMVVVNLYPFVKTVSAGASPEAARANIDIGGPCLVRAAAKNFLRVASVTDPADYSSILEELRNTGGILSLKTRFELAKKAFVHTAAYDAAISAYWGKTSFESVKSCYKVK
jgi:phosphoribosylaminoimidazolecarboxamide formyltransferase/IMP cyclohydrolase